MRAASAIATCAQVSAMTTSPRWDSEPVAVDEREIAPVCCPGAGQIARRRAIRPLRDRTDAPISLTSTAET